jgi:hypothetical protein
VLVTALRENFELIKGNTAVQIKSVFHIGYYAEKEF